MLSQELAQQLNVDGAVLEYELVGAGDPVVLIHGALLAEAFAPLCAEPALTAHSQLVRYHRRGYAGSSRMVAPFSIAQQAADCVAVLRHLGIERAHVVGHSSGGTIAHYGEFVQLERWKANGQFGVNRTVVSVRSNELVSTMSGEAMLVVDGG